MFNLIFVVSTLIKELQKPNKKQRRLLDEIKKI